MTHFRDLTPYSYSQRGIHAGTVNIGWLSGTVSFPKGKVSDAIVDRLGLFCLSPVLRTRGFYCCELCSRPPLGPLEYSIGSESCKLGTAEIRVFGDDGQIYAAPDLVMHYVCDHQYVPPKEFTDALLAADLPGSARYRELVEQLKLDR